MSKFTIVLTSIVVVACSQFVSAVELGPVTEFTIRGQTVGGQGDYIDSDPFGFFGYIQNGSGYVDETFFEFDLRSLTPGQPTTVEMRILNAPPSSGPVSRRFDVSTYVGSGTPELCRFGTGDYFTTLTIAAPPGPYQGLIQTFDLDVTSQISDAIAAGNQFWGIRLYNTVDVESGSDTTPIVEYLYNSAKLTSVPEPSSVVLLGAGIALILARLRRRSR
jgi:hypothetical protein